MGERGGPGARVSFDVLGKFSLSRISDAFLL